MKQFPNTCREKEGKAMSVSETTLHVATFEERKESPIANTLVSKQGLSPIVEEEELPRCSSGPCDFSPMGALTFATPEAEERPWESCGIPEENESEDEDEEMLLVLREEGNEMDYVTPKHSDGGSRKARGIPEEEAEILTILNSKEGLVHRLVEVKEVLIDEVKEEAEEKGEEESEKVRCLMTEETSVSGSITPRVSHQDRSKGGNFNFLMSRLLKTKKHDGSSDESSEEDDEDSEDIEEGKEMTEETESNVRDVHHPQPAIILKDKDCEEAGEEPGEEARVDLVQDAEKNLGPEVTEHVDILVDELTKQLVGGMALLNDVSERAAKLK